MFFGTTADVRSWVKIGLGRAELEAHFTPTTDIVSLIIGTTQTAIGKWRDREIAARRSAKSQAIVG